LSTFNHFFKLKRSALLPKLGRKIKKLNFVSVFIFYNSEKQINFQFLSEISSSFGDRDPRQWMETNEGFCIRRSKRILCNKNFYRYFKNFPHFLNIFNYCSNSYFWPLFSLFVLYFRMHIMLKNDIIENAQCLIFCQWCFIVIMLNTILIL
jgi:hypothetical protein